MATYNYRLVFPTDGRAVKSQTARIISDRLYAVGDQIEHHGQLWTVSQAPLEEPDDGDTVDLMMWPAE
jgi:hypothetical protein